VDGGVDHEAGAVDAVVERRLPDQHDELHRG
jgi:hypothetical protein